MNLWILSDLHGDHRKTMLQPPAGADVAVVAGDACDDGWLAEIAKQMPVVFVAGNHEFYGHEHRERLMVLQDIPGVTVLENAVTAIGGVFFVGATLWTDYGRDPLAADTARRGMNDHRLIKWRKEPWERFLPSHAATMHDYSREYICRALEFPFAGPRVVVTHHAPHENSVHPRFAGQVINRAYYSDLGPLIEACKPDLWVHGHVHNCFDYHVGGTRVLCNPRGYLGENAEFNPCLMVAL